MITIQGKGVSTGVAAGPLYFYQRAKGTLRRYEVEDREAEFARFKEAQAKAIEQLGVLAEKARAEAGDEAAMLFETHQMMCEDLDYEEAIEGFIKEQGLNAEAAVTDAGAIQRTHGYILAGGVSIPTRNVHTPGEIYSLKDVEGAVAILKSALEG
jgi:phosphotransferase system enzyme I (PtsI)